MKENFWKKKRHQSALKHALYSASINIFNALNFRHTCNHLWSMQNRWGCAYLWCGHTGSAKIMHSTPLTKGTSGRVHKLQSKSQTNALEPSSSYSFLFLCHSKVLPPLPLPLLHARLWLKCFVGMQRCSLRRPLCHSLCQMLGTYLSWVVTGGVPEKGGGGN